MIIKFLMKQIKKNLDNNNRLTKLEEGIAGIGAGEYCLQILYGIPMSQNETIRP